MGVGILWFQTKAFVLLGYMEDTGSLCLLSMFSVKSAFASGLTGRSPALFAALSLWKPCDVGRMAPPQLTSRFINFQVGTRKEDGWIDIVASCMGYNHIFGIFPSTGEQVRFGWLPRSLFSELAGYFAEALNILLCLEQDLYFPMHTPRNYRKG